MMTTIDSSLVRTWMPPLAVVASESWIRFVTVGVVPLWAPVSRGFGSVVSVYSNGPNRLEVAIMGGLALCAYSLYKVVVGCDWWVLVRSVQARLNRVLIMRHFTGGPVLPPWAVAGDDAVSSAQYQVRMDATTVPTTATALAAVAADDRGRVDLALALQHSSIIAPRAGVLPIMPEVTVVTVDRRTVVAAGLAHVSIDARKGYEHAMDRRWTDSPAFWWCVYLRFKVTKYGQLMNADATRADRLASQRALVNYIETLRVEPAHTARWLSRVWALLENDASADFSLQRFLRIQA